MRRASLVAAVILIFLSNMGVVEASTTVEGKVAAITASTSSDLEGKSVKIHSVVMLLQTASGDTFIDATVIAREPQYENEHHFDVGDNVRIIGTLHTVSREDISNLLDKRLDDDLPEDLKKKESVLTSILQFLWSAGAPPFKNYPEKLQWLEAISIRKIP